VPRKCIELPDGERSTPYYATFSEETGRHAKSLQRMRRHLPALVRTGVVYVLDRKARLILADPKNQLIPLPELIESVSLR